MRFLLSTIGSRGDVQPLVALAMELRALEQGVRFCVPPDFQTGSRDREGLLELPGGRVLAAVEDDSVRARGEIRRSRLRPGSDRTSDPSPGN